MINDWRNTIRRLALFIVIVFGTSSCSLDNRGEVASNETIHKWIVLTWSIPPIGSIKISRINASCHLEPGGLYNSGVSYLDVIGSFSLVIAVSDPPKNKKLVGARCQFLFTQSAQWASTNPEKFILWIAPSVATTEKITKLHIDYEPGDDETDYLPNRFSISRIPN